MIYECFLTEKSLHRKQNARSQVLPGGGGGGIPASGPRSLPGKEGEGTPGQDRGTPPSTPLLYRTRTNVGRGRYMPLAFTQKECLVCWWILKRSLWWLIWNCFRWISRISITTLASYQYKKVLLRERKRHTDRRLWSTPSVNRSGVPPCRGTPSPHWGTPHQGTPVGVPPSGYPPGWGIPHQGTPCWDTHPHQGTPHLGTPHQGIPHLGSPGQGTAPPIRVPSPGPGSGTPARCGQTDGWIDRHVSKHYLPVVLRTRSVKMTAEIVLMTRRLIDPQY